MTEYLTALTSALALAKQAREIGTTLKHAELKNIIGDLSLQLADVKIAMADLIEENHRLKRELEGIKNADGEPCPKCLKRTFRVERSRKDPARGILGFIQRDYVCTECSFAETRTLKGPE